MRKIVTIKFGSHLYGTSTPASDIDIKSVYVPCARDIALQRVKGSISNKRDKYEGEKNFAGELDEESYSLQRFLDLAAEGQTVALDVLFAPEWAMIGPPAPEWIAIMKNRNRLLTRKSAAFVGYCRQQANKYGIKGSRVAAAREALKLLDLLVEEHGTTAKLGTFEDEIERSIAGIEHSETIDIPTGSTGIAVKHWGGCGRKMPFSASLKTARDIAKRLALLWQMLRGWLGEEFVTVRASAGWWPSSSSSALLRLQCAAEIPDQNFRPQSETKKPAGLIRRAFVEPVRLHSGLHHRHFRAHHHFLHRHDASARAVFRHCGVNHRQMLVHLPLFRAVGHSADHSSHF